MPHQLYRVTTGQITHSKSSYISLKHKSLNHMSKAGSQFWTTQQTQPSKKIFFLKQSITRIYIYFSVQLGEGLWGVGDEWGGRFNKLNAKFKRVAAHKYVISASFPLNPFTATAWTISRLKSARTCLQTVHFPVPIPSLLSVLCIRFLWIYIYKPFHVLNSEGFQILHFYQLFSTSSNMAVPMIEFICLFTCHMLPMTSPTLTHWNSKEEKESGNWSEWGRRKKT